MPDNWSFVIAAYGVTAAVLAWYWRSLNRRERDAAPRLASRRAMPGATASAGGHSGAGASSLEGAPRR